MTRVRFSLALAVVLGVTAYTLAGAQGPGRGPRGGGPGGGVGPGLARMADLTEQQREEIRAIRQQAQQDARQAGQAGQLHRQLQAEIFGEAPDQQKLTAIQAQILEAETARLARQIEVEQKIAQVLTAEQRARVRERLAAAPERGHRGGGRPGAGPRQPGAAGVR